MGVSFFGGGGEKGRGARTHHFRPRHLPPRVLDAPAAAPVEDALEVRVAQARGQLDAADRHGGGGLLERGEGAVQVERHAVGGLADAGLGVAAAAGELDDELLGLAVAEVEAGAFEHEALEADDDFGGLLELLAAELGRESIVLFVE